MAVLLSEIYTEVRALLHDPAIRFTDALLFPLAKKAYSEWQNHLTNNGVAILHETSSAITVPAGRVDADLTEVSRATGNMILPIHVEERAVGEDNSRWIGMKRRAWEQSTMPSETLQSWTYREGYIQFIGATVDRQIRIRYMRTLTPLVDGTSTVEFGDAGKPFISARTAALAAMYIGDNPSRAQTLNDDANMQVVLAVNVAVKQTQSIGTRRRPFGARRRYRR